MESLVKRREGLLGQLAAAGNCIKGSITGVCSTCGRAHCICTKKSGARVYRLTYKDAQQKTQIVYIPRKRLPEMKRLISNYVQMREIRRKLFIS